MSEIATVLLAAFGGGLAGAVLQPVVSHGLERLRRSEEIRKSRERSLRRMLNSMIIAGRETIELSSLIDTRIFAGNPLTYPEIVNGWEKITQRLESRTALWQPERIENPVLQEAVREYREVWAKLASEIMSPAPGAQKGAKLVGDLEALQCKITICMDELNWPEVDD